MPYTVGISTGFYWIARSQELLGMELKIAYGATAGVQTVQIDIESTAEFLEPQLKERVRRLTKEMGMKVGVHGEMGGGSALESGERRIWEESQRRTCETLKNCADLGFLFDNIHLSTQALIQYDEETLRYFGPQYQVVAPDGNSFVKFAEKSEAAKKACLEHLEWSPRTRGASIDEDISDEVRNRLFENAMKDAKKIAEARVEHEIKKEFGNQNIPPDELRVIRERIFQNIYPRIVEDKKREVDEQMYFNSDLILDMWKRSQFGQYALKYGELSAYMIVAEHMYGTKDQLWMNIVGDVKPHDAYLNKMREFNAAVCAKYIEGHLLRKDHPFNKQILGGMSIKEYLEKNKIYMLFEIPEAGDKINVRGKLLVPAEGLYRLYDPRHSYHLIKKIGSPYVKLTIDIEHMLSQKLDPYKVIPELAGDFGAQVKMFHLGKPLPYGGTVHIPIVRGGRSTEVLYKWLYDFRQKGFRDGWLIYERGGGQTPLEVIRDSVQSLRLIAEHLEKNIPPDELPEKFYGTSVENVARYKRQVVNIRDHAFDPLTGLIAIPEEAHSFLGRAAIEKGKAEEWKKGRFR